MSQLSERLLGLFLAKKNIKRQTDPYDSAMMKETEEYHEKEKIGQYLADSSLVSRPCDLRNNCGSNFGCISLLVTKVANVVNKMMTYKKTQRKQKQTNNETTKGCPGGEWGK